MTRNPFGQPHPTSSMPSWSAKDSTPSYGPRWTSSTGPTGNAGDSTLSACRTDEDWAEALMRRSPPLWRDELSGPSSWMSVEWSAPTVYPLSPPLEPIRCHGKVDLVGDLRRERRVGSCQPDKRAGHGGSWSLTVSGPALELSAGLRDEIQLWRRVGRAVPVCLRRLRAQARTALISNARPHLRTRMAADHLDDVADEIVLILRGRLRQIPPRIFQLTLERLAVTPDQALLSDDARSCNGSYFDWFDHRSDQVRHSARLIPRGPESGHRVASARSERVERACGRRLKNIRPDFDLAAPGLREAWDRGDRDRFLVDTLEEPIRYTEGKSIGIKR